MAKAKAQKTRTPDTRTKRERDAYSNTLNAGINHLTVQSLGDTSELRTQVESFKQYAKNQGIDPKKDLNGLPRHIELYANIVPETQKRERESLIKTVTENFDYLVNQLPADILLQTAVRLGRTDAEKGLEKVLTESPDKTNEVKKAFGELYDPSALIQSYIALNDNPTEIAQCAAGALERSYIRRATKFQYPNKNKKPTINKRKVLSYVTEQIEKVEKENANEAMLLIGSSLARKKILKEQEKTKESKENKSK